MLGICKYRKQNVVINKDNSDPKLRLSYGIWSNCLVKFDYVYVGSSHEGSLVRKHEKNIDTTNKTTAITSIVYS